MATEIVMPALGMAQETGVLVHWLKREGEAVVKGEPIMEIETDKATVEVEAPASGRLSQVSAREGDVVPVGKTIALILAVGEAPATDAKEKPSASGMPASREVNASPVAASPLARKIAAEHGLELADIPSNGERITKEDVLAHLAIAEGRQAGAQPGAGKISASPKARRLAAERGLALAEIAGSGPGGAVLAADVLSALPVAGTVAKSSPALSEPEMKATQPGAPGFSASPQEASLSNAWRVMAERMSTSWSSAPHFYLVREVQAGALIALRERVSPLVEKRSGIRPTYTDLLVRLVAATLRDHPRLLGSWSGDGIRLKRDINIGVAVGTEDGLVVPVIHQADTRSIGELALLRQELVKRAGEHSLRPGDLNGGTFTLTNLGMYNVDAFMAILNPPQAAILSVGRIADRVIAVNGQPAVRPVMILTLSCDHRVVDGLRGAQFLDDLAKLIEEPWGLLA